MADLVLPSFSDVEAAERRIRRFVARTPVLTNASLDEACGGRVLVKAECLQWTGSFKLRGAMNRLLQIPEDERAAGVVAFSSGNHAQGVARAARLLDMPALIVMPQDAPQVKIDGVKADGGEIRFYDRNTENREEIAAQEADLRGAIIVPSFDDPMIIAGQGSAGIEFAQQAEAYGAPLDHLVCGMGGGGLVNGLALAFQKLSPQTKIWGVEPVGHEDWARSLAAGEPVSNAPGVRSFCDAILTDKPGKYTWALGRKLLSRVLTVTDDEVRRAMVFAFRHLKLVAEPGGCVALAAILSKIPADMRGQRIGIVLTGANVDADQFTEIISG